MEHVQLKAINKNEAYSEKVYRQLKQLIVTNQIKPGEALNERELADSLSVSRTPVRDALRMLEQEGWVTKNGKFKTVSLLTWKKVRDLLELRRPLELTSYDLAVKRITAEDIAALEKTCDEMRRLSEKNEANDYYMLMTCDINFHLQIAKTTKNDRMIQIMSDLGDQLIRTSILSVRYGDLSVGTYFANHTKLLSHLKSGEFDVGREELIHHIRTWEQHLNSVPAALHIADDESFVF